MPSRRKIREAILLVAAAAVLATVGCGQKKLQAVAPVATPPKPDARPMTIAPDTDATPPLETATAAPAMSAPSTASTAVADIAPAKPNVPPPRRPAAQPAQEETAEQDANATPPLRMTPELSPSDQVAVQRKIDDDSAAAMRNLGVAGARRLNATQQDLANKIHSFLDQSHDASKQGDWFKAQNFALKARQLSDELINSL